MYRIPNRIFVGGIPKNASQIELKEYFSNFGMVKDARIITDSQGVSKGYGFVTYEDENDASRVLGFGDSKLLFKETKLNVGHAFRKKNNNGNGMNGGAGNGGGGYGGGGYGGGGHQNGYNNHHSNYYDHQGGGGGMGGGGGSHGGSGGYHSGGGGGHHQSSSHHQMHQQQQHHQMYGHQQHHGGPGGMNMNL